ncbi:MFS transporter [Streptomyces sp. NPDC004579]|uniref:MFS transporter n=1 Tax=Streptomyces sp. NPDC004579 TaxID=3154667 RepID=UPI0033A23916
MSLPLVSAVKAPDPLDVPAPLATRPNTTIWVLVVGAGAVRSVGFSYPFLSYRLADLGFSTTRISGLLALYGLGWLVGQILWGRLADALGRRATLVGAMTVAAVTLPLLAQATSVVTVGAAAIVAGAVYDAPRPVISATVADEIPDAARRASITGWRHFAINVGAALTGATGGLLADRTGIPALFYANAAACALFAVVAHRVMPPKPPAPQRHTGSPGVGSALRDVRLWLLWLAGVLALLPVAGLFSIMPLLMQREGMPASSYGWTQVASAAAVLTLSLPLNRWLARQTARSTMVGPLAVSSLILGAGIGSAGLATSTLQYAAAAAAAVPGEVIALVAASAIVDRIAPPLSRGLYSGIWGSSLATAVIGAPVLAGWSLAQGGPAFVGLVTLLCGAAGAVICLPLGLMLRPTRAPQLLRPVHP